MTNNFLVEELEHSSSDFPLLFWPFFIVAIWELIVSAAFLLQGQTASII
jgi:hypothetical protein